MCRLRPPDIVCVMSRSQVSSPRARRLSGPALDPVVLIVECLGSVGAVWLTVHWSHQACAPDGDGLEFLGVMLGLGLLGLLLSAFACTLGGLVWRHRGALVTGRVLVALCVLGCPPIPPMIVGLGIAEVVRWSC